MAERALIRQGDKTTHGGTVLTGDPTLLIYGRPAARVGDQVSCPLCKKIGRIVTGAPTMFDGQSIARHDDLTDCGAKLIASQSTDVYGDGEESTASAPPSVSEENASDMQSGAEEVSGAALAAQPDVDDEPFAIRFQAIDPETNAPVARCVYILTRENGTQHGGLTDREGYTETIETNQKEQIAVHFAFKSPVGKFIDREDLR